MTSAAVLDASTLVSAFLTPGPARELLAHAERGTFRLVLSPSLVEETRRALLRPKLLAAYRHTPEAVAQFCHAIEALAPIVEGAPGFVSACRDPNDHHVIAAALAGGADHLVSGDRDLRDLGEHQGVRILAARPFLDLLTAP